MAYEFEIIEAAPSQMLAVRERVKLSELSKVIQTLLGEVWSLMRAHGIRETGHNVVVYRNAHTEDNDIVFDCVFGVEVSGDVPTTERVVVEQTPSGRAVRVVYFGPYDGLRGVNQAIRDWSQSTGNALSSTSWEVYGDWSDDPSKLETDVYYLLDG